MKMLFKTLALGCGLFLMTFSANAQKTVGGVTMPASFKAGNTTVVLNGAGIREKMWIDLYVGGLYLQSTTTSSQKVINQDAPMAIRLEIVSGMISSEKMITAVEEGFSKSTDDKEKLRTEIDQFISAFSDEITKGDVFEIIYSPSKGTEVYKNGTLKKTVQGLEFKKGLFGIWLCSEPADADLKKAMLGLK